MCSVVPEVDDRGGPHKAELCQGLVGCGVPFGGRGRRIGLADAFEGVGREVIGSREIEESKSQESGERVGRWVRGVEAGGGLENLLSCTRGRREQGDS